MRSTTLFNQEAVATSAVQGEANKGGMGGRIRDGRAEGKWAGQRFRDSSGGRPHGTRHHSHGQPERPKAVRHGSDRFPMELHPGQLPRASVKLVQSQPGPQCLPVTQPGA